MAFCWHARDPQVGPELSRTIETLANAGVRLDCVVVADGLQKLSESMKAYLVQTFQLGKAVLNPESYIWRSHHQTFISDTVTLGASGSTFAVLLKRFNHKKINTVPCAAPQTLDPKPNP